MSKEKRADKATKVEVSSPTPIDPLESAGDESTVDSRPAYEFRDFWAWWDEQQRAYDLLGLECETVDEARRFFELLRAAYPQSKPDLADSATRVKREAPSSPEASAGESDLDALDAQHAKVAGKFQRVLWADIAESESELTYDPDLEKIFEAPWPSISVNQTTHGDPGQKPSKQQRRMRQRRRS